MKKSLIVLVLALVACTARADFSDWLKSKPIERSDPGPVLTALQGTQWHGIFSMVGEPPVLTFASKVEDGRLSFSGKSACNRYEGYLYRKQNGNVASSVLPTPIECSSWGGWDGFKNIITQLSNVEMKEGREIRLGSKNGVTTLEKVATDAVSPVTADHFPDAKHFQGTLWRTTVKGIYPSPSLLGTKSIYFSLTDDSTLDCIIFFEEEKALVVRGTFVKKVKGVEVSAQPEGFFKVSGKDDIIPEAQNELDSLLTQLSEVRSFSVSEREGGRSLSLKNASGDTIGDLNFAEVGFEKVAVPFKSKSQCPKRYKHPDGRCLRP